jgi:hypothetical protein
MAFLKVGPLTSGGHLPHIPQKKVELSRGQNEHGCFEGRDAKRVAFWDPKGAAQGSYYSFRRLFSSRHKNREKIRSRNRSLSVCARLMKLVEKKIK